MPTSPRSPEAIEKDRQERVRGYIGRLSEADWSRIQQLARSVTDNFSPARLEDLDAKGLAVGVCRSGDEERFSGEKIGVVREGSVAVLVWRK